MPGEKKLFSPLSPNFIVTLVFFCSVKLRFYNYHTSNLPFSAINEQPRLPLLNEVAANDKKRKDDERCENWTLLSIAAHQTRGNVTYVTRQKPSYERALYSTIQIM